MKKYFVPSVAALFLLCISAHALQAGAGKPASTPTAKETFGAEANPTGNPVGGGAGYKQLVKKHDYLVDSASALVEALKNARSGQVVYVADSAEIDLSGKHDVAIPAGVTLAGGRGKAGSKGALLFTNDLGVSGLFVVGGPGVRITGIRLRGPDPTRRESAYVAPNSTGIICQYPGLKIDNCEISAWSTAAIMLNEGCTDAHIHHNYIHHNQRSGLGYGVCLHKAFALVEANLFDWNRHHIAGTGAPGTSYEARYNLILENANSYSFDMHGGRDRKDGTDIGGTRINIHHNTFRMTSAWGVLICGIPQEYAVVHHNWFLHEDPKIASAQYYGLLDYTDGGFRVEIPAVSKRTKSSIGWVSAADAEIRQIPESDLARAARKDLVAHYTFDDMSQDILRDASGKKNEGMVYGNPDSQRIGGMRAVHFDGLDDFMEIPPKPALRLEQACTIMLWFNPEVIEGGLISHSNGGAWEEERLLIALRTLEVGPEFTICLADGKKHLPCYVNPPKKAVWTHLAVAFDGSSLRIYRDGMMERSIAQSLKPAFANIPMMIGSCQGYGKPLYQGLMADLRIYTRALTAEEIQYIHEKTAARLVSQ